MAGEMIFPISRPHFLHFIPNGKRHQTPLQVVTLIHNQFPTRLPSRARRRHKYRWSLDFPGHSSKFLDGLGSRFVRRNLRTVCLIVLAGQDSLLERVLAAIDPYLPVVDLDDVATILSYLWATARSITDHLVDDRNRRAIA